MIYMADQDGRINGVVTAYVVGYEATLDAAGVGYVVTEDRVDIETHWIETTRAGKRRLVARLPALVQADPEPIALGAAWSLPMVPGGATVSIDGVVATPDRAQPLTIAPEVPGVYEVVIDHPAYMSSRFTLTVTP